jgi:hypothetical protein
VNWIFNTGKITFLVKILRTLYFAFYLSLKLYSRHVNDLCIVGAGTTGLFLADLLKNNFGLVSDYRQR